MPATPRMTRQDLLHRDQPASRASSTVQPLLRRVVRVSILLTFVAPEPGPIHAKVEPSQLVMGQGGKIIITGHFAKSSIVWMDGTRLPTKLRADRKLEATVLARRFWHGPKRLIVRTGDQSTVIDGEFELAALRPFGTKLIPWDFEDQPKPKLIGGKNSYRGKVGGHYLYSLQRGDRVAAAPDHGSSYSFRQEIGSITRTRIWIADWADAAVTEPDGTIRQGRGRYIAEAVGMNRLVYDVKAPKGYAAENNIGTYYSDPDRFRDGRHDDPESNNWHFYVYHKFIGHGEWRTHYSPLFHQLQRQSGGCCSGVGQMGLGGTMPVAHVRGKVNSRQLVRWKRGGKLFTNSSFDILTRLYIDQADYGSRRSFAGDHVWFDNVGFASVDERLEKSAKWIIQDAPTREIRAFPFSFTNWDVKPRNFHVAISFAGSAHSSYVQPMPPEGLYHDLNANGAFDKADRKLEDRPDKNKVLPTPLAPGETRWFILRMRAHATKNDHKTTFVNFVEAGRPRSEAAYRLTPRYGNLNAPMHPDSAYMTFVFHLNTPEHVSHSLAQPPQNIRAMRKESGAWVVWDDAVEATKGTLAYYEVDRGDAPDNLRHFRVVSAASPGFIDRGAVNELYRVRAVSTSGDKSDWSETVKVAGLDLEVSEK